MGNTGPNGLLFLFFGPGLQNISFQAKRSVSLKETAVPTEDTHLVARVKTRRVHRLSSDLKTKLITIND